MNAQCTRDSKIERKREVHYVEVCRSRLPQEVFVHGSNE